MIWLILGLILWSGAHLFKRLAPAARASMGDAGKGVVAIASLAALALMVVGYQSAEGEVFWGRNPALTGINNLLMLISVYLFAASGMQTAVARRMRHPMLIAVKIWVVAHLLVNGDVPSFVLFGGILAWAVAEVVMINRAQRDWTPPAPAPARKEIIALVASIVVFGAIAWVHGWLLGFSVFG